MNDQDKTREQLIAELAELRQRVADQDSQLARCRQAEADQRQINSSLPVLVATAGLDGYYQEVNAAFQHILGWTEQESLSRPFLEFIHPEDRAVAVQAFTCLKAGERVINFLDRNICKDGSHRWINWTVIPVLDRGIVFGIGQDITGMKQAADELRRSEARWRSVIENVPVQVGTVDRAGTILFLNRPAPGLTLERVLGTSVFEYLQPEHCDQARECIEHVFRTGETVVNESVATGPHGTQSWYETRLGPVKVDEQVVAVALISSDVTQRKRWETALRESEERFQAFMDNAPCMAWMKDEHGRYMYVSKSFEKRFAIRREDWLGTTDFVHWSAECAEQFRKNDMAVLASGRVLEVLEETASDGSLSYWWTLKFPFRPAAGQVCVGGMAVDITARLQAEKALQKAHDELEEEVKKRTAELAIFRRFAEASGQGIGMSDLHGGLSYVNPVLCQLLGEEKPEDMIGKNVSLYYPPEYQQKMADEIVPAVLRDGSWQGEQSIVSRQGTMTSTVQNAFLILDEDGNPYRLGVVVADVSDLMRAEVAVRKSEASLRQSERRFRNYFEQGLVGMAATAVDERWLEVNDRLCEILGYPRVELLQTTWDVLTYPADLDEDLSHFHDLLAGKIEYYTMDKRFVRKDGNLVYTTIHIRTFRKEDGSIDHIVALVEDITDRKLAEEAVERERQSLWRMLQASDHERRTISYEIHDGLAQYLAAAGMQFQRYDAQRKSSPNKARTAYETAVELVRQSYIEARRLISEVRPPVIDEIGIETAISHLIHEQRLRGGPKIHFDSNVQFGRLASILENALYRIA